MPPHKEKELMTESELLTYQPSQFMQYQNQQKLTFYNCVIKTCSTLIFAEQCYKKL